MKTKIHNEQIISEAPPHAILVLNKNGFLHWWNQEACNLLKIDPSLHQNIHITKIIPKFIFSRLKEKQNSKGIVTISPLDSNQHLSFILQPHLDDQQLLIVQDVTHTHRLEAMRSDFIANISHELRTPLTVFHGYLELLQSYPNIEEQQFSEMLQHMTEQNQRMESLVADLLLLSRLESVAPDIKQHKPVHVASLLKNIYEDAKSLSGEQTHQFYLFLDEELELRGEARELRSAFSNLIYNAVHYTPSNGRIEIHWYQDKAGKHMKVIDTGIGIPEKHLSRVTQRFYRIDKARSSHGKGRTGLGLAIVKHVLLRHNGQLSIASEVNQGSTFCCTFKNEI